MSGRIAVLNNYSFTRVRREVSEGLKPAHHLFGTDVLESIGYQLTYIDPDESRTWYKIGEWLGKIPFCNLGDLGIQMEAIRMRKQYDVIYAPCQTVTLLLGILAFFGLFRKKIIAVAHHPLLRGRLGRFRKYSLYFAVRGHRTFAALSTLVANELNTISRNKISVVLHWGPQIKYYDDIRADLENISEPTVETDILSVGRTGRDYETLIRAFNGTSVSVEIYAERQSVPALHYTPNIRVHYLDHPEQLKYQDIIALSMSAKVLAVPLFPDCNLSGLTSVTDAMALSMSMLVTKNKYIEADIEKEGAGYWIEPFDTTAWKDRAMSLLASREMRTHTGQNARLLAEQKFSYDVFNDELVALIRPA